MNYYERHLGDYARDAGHLTMLEHGAYTLLLDRYYTTEQGIPADQAHRVCRARTRDEKEAVDTVLAEFFTLSDGVWRNGRAEREVAKMQAKVKAAQENGKRGGRPKRTDKEPGGNPVGFGSVAQPKAHQSPDTSHQNTSVKVGEFSTTDAPWAQFPTDPPGDAEQAPGPSLAGRACLALRGANVHDVNPAHPDLLRLLAAGVKPEDIGATAAELVASGKPARMAYVLRTVESRMQQAAQRPAIEAAPAPDPMAWADTRAGVEAMGCRLGIGPFVELDHSTGRAIPFIAFRRRVLDAWRNQNPPDEMEAAA